MRIMRGITIPYEYVLKRSDGTPIDLTNAKEVKMRLVEDGTTEYTVNGVCVIDSTPTSGKVTYSWATGETSTPGFYWMSFIITYTNDKTEEVPSNGYDYLVIL